MKLNKAGIEYISEMFDEFETHVNRVAQAIQGKEISIDIDDSDLLGYPVGLYWETYWHGEVDETGFIRVDREDFLSVDYEATRIKHAKLREEKKQREKEVAESKKAKEEAEQKIKQQEFKKKNIEDEKVMLKFLMKRYPELIK